MVRLWKAVDDLNKGNWSDLILFGWRFVFGDGEGELYLFGWRFVFEIIMRWKRREHFPFRCPRNHEFSKAASRLLLRFASE